MDMDRNIKNIITDARKVLTSLDAAWRKVRVSKCRGSAKDWIKIKITVEYKNGCITEENIKLGVSLKKLACKSVEHLCKDYTMQDGYRGTCIDAVLDWYPV